ncbi:MAG: acyl-CoA desaturase, partial [Polyangiaceae bacterium]
MKIMTREELAAFGAEVDAIEVDLKKSLGQSDRRYIQRLITVQRALAVAGRVGIFASLPLLPTGLPFFAAWGLGAATLGVAKILENM